MRHWLGRLRLQQTVRHNFQGSLRRYHAVTTPLEQLILSSIKATGPISVANYMQLCLAHPIHGYYMKGDPLGVSGDFITSPEISQVFGELVAIWFLSTLQSTANRTQSKGIRLVELGPGRGTLMSDILRVLRGPFASSTPVKSVHLVETSPALKEKQEKALSTHNKVHGSSSIPMDICWHDQIEDVPEEPELYTLVIANEFFDALPVHIFEKAPDGWHEILVDSQQSIISTGNTGLLQNPPLPPPSHRLRFVLSHSPVPVPAVSQNPRFANLPLGTRVEYSRASVQIMRKIGQLISNGAEVVTDADQPNANTSAGGMALLVDYGADHLFSNSLRGVRSHQIVDPFSEPGNSDLTSNVDFATLRDALVGLSNVFSHGPISQHDFLTKMGLEPRLAGLLKKATNSERREDMKAAGMRLVDMGPQGMGRKFSFMALTNGREAPYPFL